MRTEFLLRVVLCATLTTGCSDAEVPEPASVPTAESSIALNVSVADTVAETGRPFRLELAIEERFARRDSCRLRVRVASGYAAVFFEDVPLTAETELPIPYTVANKAASSCVVALNAVPETAPVAEHTIRLVCEATSYDESTSAVDTVEIRTVNPAPIEVRTEYVRTPLLISESLPIDFAIAKADYTGSYTVVFTQTAGQGYCQGDYTVHDGETFAVGGERTEFRLDYRPTMPGEHRLLFEVSDGTFIQEAEVYCKVFSQESASSPMHDL